MSLASAQRNLAQANRKALQVEGESKMGQSLINTAAQGLQMGMAVGDAVFDISEKKQSWKDYEAGREYMGLDKSEPLTLRQKLFKRPEDIYSDRTRVGDKEYTAKEFESIGALASSKNKALYEKMMDGNLSSSLGRKYTEAMARPPLPDAPSSNPMDYIKKMDEQSIQASINQGFGVGTDNPLGRDEAAANFYKYMPEGTSPEFGEDYFNALIEQRDNLRNASAQPIQSSDKEIGK